MIYGYVYCHSQSGGGEIQLFWFFLVWLDSCMLNRWQSHDRIIDFYTFLCDYGAGSDSKKGRESC